MAKIPEDLKPLCSRLKAPKELGGGTLDAVDIWPLIERIGDREEELEQWKTWGIIEIAVRNPNVKAYMDHWEGRTAKAEAKVERSRWRKITETDLPKIGDEVLYMPLGVMEVDRMRAARTYNEWDCSQAVAFRSIDPPKDNSMGCPIIEDARVPPGEVWFYSTRPAHVISPYGETMLNIPDAKIVNIGEPEKKSSSD